MKGQKKLFETKFELVFDFVFIFFLLWRTMFSSLQALTILLNHFHIFHVPFIMIYFNFSPIMQGSSQGTEKLLWISGEDFQLKKRSFVLNVHWFLKTVSVSQVCDFIEHFSFDSYENPYYLLAVVLDQAYPFLNSLILPRSSSLQFERSRRIC